MGEKKEEEKNESLQFTETAKEIRGWICCRWEVFILKAKHDSTKFFTSGSS